MALSKLQDWSVKDDGLGIAVSGSTTAPPSPPSSCPEPKQLKWPIKKPPLTIIPANLPSPDSTPVSTPISIPISIPIPIPIGSAKGRRSTSSMAVPPPTPPLTSALSAALRSPSLFPTPLSPDQEEFSWRSPSTMIWGSPSSVWGSPHKIPTSAGWGPFPPTSPLVLAPKPGAPIVTNRFGPVGSGARMASTGAETPVTPRMRYSDSWSDFGDDDTDSIGTGFTDQKADKGSNGKVQSGRTNHSRATSTSSSSSTFFSFDHGDSEDADDADSLFAVLASVSPAMMTPDAAYGLLTRLGPVWPEYTRRYTFAITRLAEFNIRGVNVEIGEWDEYQWLESERDWLVGLDRRRLHLWQVSQMTARPAGAAEQAK